MKLILFILVSFTTACAFKPQAQSLNRLRHDVLACLHKGGFVCQGCLLVYKPLGMQTPVALIVQSLLGSVKLKVSLSQRVPIHWVFALSVMTLEHVIS